MKKMNDDWKDKGWFIPAGLLLLVATVWWLPLLSMGCCCMPKGQVLNVRIVEVVADVWELRGIKIDPRFESDKMWIPRDDVAAPAVTSYPFNDGLIIKFKSGGFVFLSANFKKYPKAFAVTKQMYKDTINWIRGNGIIIIQKKFTKRDIEQTQQKFPYRKER